MRLPQDPRVQGGQSLNPHRGMQAAGQEGLKETHIEVILEDPSISTRKH